MLVSEIVRKAIPGASGHLAQDILWSRTPFPAGKVTARDLYKAARRLQRAKMNGIHLCEFCDNQCGADKYLCTRCDEALHPPG